MDEAAAAQVRDRVGRWAEEGREVLAVLPQVLEAADKGLNARSEQAEMERLRKEVGELRKDVVEFQRVVEELRRENQQLRAEKDEVGQAFARLMETVQSTNQIAQKFGVTKSPFARREPPAPAGTPAQVSNPTPGP